MELNQTELRAMYESLRELCNNVDLDSIPMFRKGSKLLPRCKSGSGIHIKKENRGKFTASAKKAGQSVQEGDIIARQDNIRVVKPPIPERIKAKPRQYYFVDLDGKPSNDNRTSEERNRDYWHPLKGAKERFKASMKNGTNPLVGIERTIRPAMAGAALVTTPATLVSGIIGSEAVNKATGGFGQWLESKTGIPSEVGEYLNPGEIYGRLRYY